jgi:hypothetical protein
MYSILYFDFGGNGSASSSLLAVLVHSSPMPYSRDRGNDRIGPHYFKKNVDKIDFRAKKASVSRSKCVASHS